jgi:hypothetical protein
MLGFVLCAAAAGVGVAALSSASASAQAKNRAPEAPAADLVSFCHLDDDGTGSSSAVVLRQSSSVYSAHDAHGDCLVADGTATGRACDRTDADADALCDAHGDPAID